MRLVLKYPGFVIGLVAALFAIFPLTDTDIWWHLACAREWVTTWTPVRAPVVNVHEYFQVAVSFVYGLGGAPLLVVFKALLWGSVFVLFLRKAEHAPFAILSVIAAILFLFRYQFEMRPVAFSLVFLGVYWNVLPWLFGARLMGVKKVLIALAVLCLQWFWCKCQGLYILGPIFALCVCASIAFANPNRNTRNSVASGCFVLGLFAMPFLHSEGLRLFLYPLGLLDRLLGLSQSAAIFASEIAENRSPVTLALQGENRAASAVMIVLAVVGLFIGIRQIVKRGTANTRFQLWKSFSLLTTATLALVAERNFVLFMPVLLCAMLEMLNSECVRMPLRGRGANLVCIVIMACVFGLWCRSLAAYDLTMVSYQRVPVAATEWMAVHPHAGRLFNDDRAGGYLAFMNPADSIYIDGRFMLKSADFFENYLQYANKPNVFIRDADSLGIDRAVFPLRYYARWNKLLAVLQQTPHWKLAYYDEFFAVFDKN